MVNFTFSLQILFISRGYLGQHFLPYPLPLLWVFPHIFFFGGGVALGLRCCAQAFSSCGEWGLLFVVVRGLLIVVPSLVAEHRL